MATRTAFICAALIIGSVVWAGIRIFKYAMASLTSCAEDESRSETSEASNIDDSPFQARIVHFPVFDCTLLVLCLHGFGQNLRASENIARAVAADMKREDAAIVALQGDTRIGYNSYVFGGKDTTLEDTATLLYQESLRICQQYAWPEPHETQGIRVVLLGYSAGALTAASCYLFQDHPPRKVFAIAGRFMSRETWESLYPTWTNRELTAPNSALVCHHGRTDNVWNWRSAQQEYQVLVELTSGTLMQSFQLHEQADHVSILARVLPIIAAEIDAIEDI